MSPARLLEHFDRLIDTPDAVPRLRRFILDLAVRGKLVEQNPKDEPAVRLLGRIAKARKRQSSSSGNVVSANAAHTKGVVPMGWQAVQFREVLLELQTGPFGSSLHQKDYELGGTPVVNPASIQAEKIVPIAKMAVGQKTLDRLATFKLRKNDVVMGRRGEMGRSAVVTEQESGWLCGTGSLVLRFTNEISPWFIVKLMGSPSIREYLGGASVGATMQNLNQSIMQEMPVGLPPLAEQHRIVAKVDELMALCDELEAAQTKREKRRDRLVAAILHGLNNGDAPPTPAAPSTFKERARFYFNHFPRLTTRPEHIHQLRQTILNLAICGKLVPQDPKDKPSVGIASTKAQKSEIPFEIPESWGWTRLKNLGPIRGGGTPSKARPELWGGDIPWVSPKDMKRDYIVGAQMRITAKGIEQSAVKLIEAGSILFVVRGMILAHSFPVALAMVPVTVNQDMKALTPHVPAMGEFILRVLKGLRDGVLSKVQRSSHGTCRLESSDYEDLLFPLPPLAEQRRIVAKVDELMALCDALEMQLSTCKINRQGLLGAFLFNAIPA